MTTEEELRKELAEFGVGLEVLEFSKKDRVNLYPTRSKGIHKMSLELRCHLKDVELANMMKYCLSKAEFETWQKNKQVTLVVEKKEGQQ